MADKKSSNNDTLKPEKTIFTVFRKDGTKVSVEAISSDEAVKKANAKD